MGYKYDFAGWASKNNVKCADGRTIRANAFKECDGKTVPLVFMHNHKDVDNVLGHVLLENRNEGLYAYGSFNESELAQTAKVAVAHGDITALSIYANQLKEKNGNVFHGRVREVSLVLAGANDGAVIEYPVIQHSDGSLEPDYEADEAIIEMSAMEGEHLDEGGYLEDEDDEPEEEFIEHADEEDEEVAENEGGKSRSLEDIINGLSKEDQDVVYSAFSYAVDNAAELKKQIGGADDEDEDDDGEAQHYYEEGEDDMKLNLFEGVAEQGSELSHADFMDLQEATFRDAASYGHLRDSFLAHAAEYGIESIDYLFPEAQNINGNTPEFLNYDQEWVNVVMNGVKHTPFSRIKTTYADITEDEARAKGYMKGNRKTEEVFGLLRRVTTPCTIYKKQKMDRDDILDIKDFDIVGWLKQEMRLKLNEEIARAILFSDGRSSLSPDKIKEDNIRPIIKEDDLFCIKYTVQAGADADATAKNVIRGAIKARKGYRGTGTPIMFMSEDLLSDMLLLEDKDGHDLYESQSKLETKMRVSKIVTIPDEVFPADDIYGLIVNLSDYTVGADKGGSVSMFEDFDIDYNQEKYLMETRCSGSLVRPYSAIVLKKSNG